MNSPPFLRGLGGIKGFENTPYGKNAVEWDEPVISNEKRSAKIAKPSAETLPQKSANTPPTPELHHGATET